jgi:hypothetical protein
VGSPPRGGIVANAEAYALRTCAGNQTSDGLIVA